VFDLDISLALGGMHLRWTTCTCNWRERGGGERERCFTSKQRK